MKRRFTDLERAQIALNWIGLAALKCRSIDFATPFIPDKQIWENIRLKIHGGERSDKEPSSLTIHTMIRRNDCLCMPRIDGIVKAQSSLSIVANQPGIDTNMI